MKHPIEMGIAIGALSETFSNENTRMHAVRCVVVCCLIHFVVGEAASNLEGLLDTWEVVAIESDGEKLSDAVVRAIGGVVTLKDGRYVGRANYGGTMEGSFQYDTAARPYGCEFVDDHGAFAGKVRQMIFKLEGDTLTVCAAPHGDPRPKAFTTAKGSRQMLTVYKRKTRK